MLGFPHAALGASSVAQERCFRVPVFLCGELQLAAPATTGSFYALPARYPADHRQQGGIWRTTGPPFHPAPHSRTLTPTPPLCSPAFYCTRHVPETHFCLPGNTPHFRMRRESRATFDIPWTDSFRKFFEYREFHAPSSFAIYIEILRLKPTSRL